MSAKGAVGSVRRFSSFHIFSALLIVPFLLAPAMAAHAATYTVTNLNDSGTGSLRAAITSANGDTAGVIVFTPGLTGTITLASALPNITTTGTMTITGPGANLLTISGANTYQILGFTSGTTSFSGLTFADGAVSTTNGYQTEYNSDFGWGGAFYITGGTTVNIANCVFYGNSTTNDNGGGAILNEGTMSVVNSLFYGNTSPGYEGGGAIFNLGVTTIQGSTFAYNYAFNEGSAILNYGDAATNNFGQLTVVDSTFVGNMVPTNGGSLGAIYNETSATLTLRDSTFALNLPATGGSITNGGTMTLTNNVIVETATGSHQCAALTTATQCPAFPSSPDANGNFDDVAANLKVMQLGYYGGLNPTVLPMPGSELLCGGATAGAKDVNGNALAKDERGFGLDPACTTGKVDAGAVQAHFLTVTTTADPGSGTCGATCALRDAMTEANATGAEDIVFASAVTGTIKLGSELPVVTGVADLVGPGANLLTISGNSANPVFGVTNGTLDIAGLTIAGGKSASNGGGINNTTGLVTLTNAVLSGNAAVSDGGAIDNGGVVLASDSTISGNTASLGSAIYNTGVVNLGYSTLAGNAATSAGGIYNNSGGLLTAVNTTFAANTGSTGPGIDNLGTLAMENSVLDAAECAGTGCATTAGSGNVVGATKLAALGSYGGPTPTVLPQPGSSAICAGLAADIPALALTDQRGFANENTSYTGYSSTTPCVDSGAVQTNYTSAQFTSAGPFTATANAAGTTPSVIVSVTENGQNIGGVPVTLGFTGTGTATGTTATTVAGTGATFTGLTVSAASAQTDSLAVSMPVVGTDVLSAAAVTLTVNPPAGTAPTISFSVPNHTYGDAAFTVAATSNSTGAFTYGVVSGNATVSGTTVTLTGAGPVTLQATEAATGSYASGSATATFQVSQANQTITFTGLPTAATYGSAGPYTLNGKASSGLTVNYALSGTAGAATISGTTLSITGAGTVTVTASQAGNGNYNTATPVSQTIVVSAKANQTITFTGLPATATYGAAGPYTLNGKASSGLTVSYALSGTAGAATISGTTLTITGAGTVTVTASQAGNGSYNAATPVSQATVVSQASSSTSLGAATLTPAQGQADLLTATVTGAGTLSGSVVFKAGSTTLCTVAVSGGKATCSYTPATTGSVSVSAQYQGDANHTASSVTSLTLNVSTPYDSAISLQLASTQLTYPGQTNVTACVTGAKGVTATGSVLIYDGSTLLTAQPQLLQGNGCAYPYISGLAAGTHSIKATYSGDKNNSGGTSAATTVTVAPVAVNLAASCWLSGNYYCAVTASSNAGPPTGSITYTVDKGSPVTVALSSGNATITVSNPAKGNHTVSISYAQQGNFAAAGPLTETFTE